MNSNIYREYIDNIVKEIDNRLILMIKTYTDSTSIDPIELKKNLELLGHRIVIDEVRNGYNTLRTYMLIKNNKPIAYFTVEEIFNKDNFTIKYELSEIKKA